MRSLALLRVLAGPAVLLHLQPFLSDAFDGRIYSDAFYEPYASWYPEAPRGLYVALLVLAAIAAVAMSIGLLTRLATATTFAIVTYNLFLSTTHFHNNRAYLVIVLAVLAVAPCGRELSLDAWIRRRRGRPALDLTAPAWPLWLLRFECAAIYAASGTSKLLDPDWFGGTVPWQRVVQARDELHALPHWAVSVLTDRDVYTVAAKVIVLTELFIAAGLWSRRTRYAAVWIAVVFHTDDRGVGVGSGLLVPRHRGARDLGGAVDPGPRAAPRPDDRAPQATAAAVRALDWLARFRVVPAPPGSPLEVVDRDGTTIRGAPAAAFAAEPSAADRLVRAADAAASQCPPRPRPSASVRRLGG